MGTRVVSLGAFMGVPNFAEFRNKLLAEGVPMRGVKRYEGFPCLMCDGEDPKGNVFQLME